MEIRIATLCDFAQVREQLLTIVAGGITRQWRTEYPAKMSGFLAVMLELSPVEANEPQELRIRIEDADGGKIAEMSAGFQISDTTAEPGELLQLPFALDLRELPIQSAGRYMVVIECAGDGPKKLVALSFRADLVANLPGQ